MWRSPRKVPTIRDKSGKIIFRVSDHRLDGCLKTTSSNWSVTFYHQSQQSVEKTTRSPYCTVPDGRTAVDGSMAYVGFYGAYFCSLRTAVLALHSTHQQTEVYSADLPLHVHLECRHHLVDLELYRRRSHRCHTGQ